MDRALYVPKSWATDRKHRQEAGMPEEAKVRLKPELAEEMLERALEVRVRRSGDGGPVCGGTRGTENVSRGAWAALRARGQEGRAVVGARRARTGAIEHP